MYVYLDDGDLIFVEQLSLEQAISLRDRTEAQLPWAYNSAHSAALHEELGALQEQIDWLEEQAVEQARRDLADEMAQDRFSDYLRGL